MAAVAALVVAAAGAVAVAAGGGPAPAAGRPGTGLSPGLPTGVNQHRLPWRCGSYSKGDLKGSGKGDLKRGILPRFLLSFSITIF